MTSIVRNSNSIPRWRTSNSSNPNGAGETRRRIQRGRRDGVGRPAPGGQRRAGARSVSRQPDPESRACHRQVVRSPIGQAIGGVLKGVAKKALPLAGTALGALRRRSARRADRQRPRLGGGRRARSGIRGLEPGRPRVRRREAVRSSRRRRRQERAGAATGGDPRSAAQAAVTQAAQAMAPGLLQPGASGRRCHRTAALAVAGTAAAGCAAATESCCSACEVSWPSVPTQDRC